MICEKCSGSGNIVVSFRPLRWEKCGCTIPTFGPSEIVIKTHSKSGGKSKTFSISEFEPHEIMAHAVVKCGIFASVSEAKRNGWNKPIEIGEFFFKKKGIKLIITEN